MDCSPNGKVGAGHARSKVNGMSARKQDIQGTKEKVWPVGGTLVVECHLR